MNIGISNNYTSPNFTGYKSVFGKKLEKAMVSPKITRQSASRLLDDFADMYDKKVIPDKKIGSGFYGTVYKIDDYYVLKRGNEKLEPEFGGIEISKKSKFAKLKHYFGDAIATIFNNNGEDMIIMKNVYSKGKSLPVGIPEDFATKHTKDECLKYYNEIYLPTFANLPQKSFDGIAKDFAQLNAMGKKGNYYTFDYVNPNNFVLAGKTLRILDEIYDHGIKTKNCVTDLLEVFLNRMDLDTEAVFDEKLINKRSSLAKKIILAGAKHKVPMYQNNSDLESWNTTLNTLLGLNISKNSLKNIVKFIDEIVSNNNNPKKRTELVKQYLERTVGL